MLTGLFLYQMNLAEFKGWSPQLMASGFTAYALVRMLSSISVGPWVDRLGAARIFPLSLVPLTMGLILLWTQSAIWVLYMFFISAGVSQGVCGVIMTVLWAQRYGTNVLGSVKSLIAMIVVFGSAISPALFGWLLASRFGFSWILPGAVEPCLLSIATGILAQRLCFEELSSSKALNQIA